MRTTRTQWGRLGACVALAVLATACRGAPPPAPVAPQAAPKASAVGPREPTPDISPVSEPEGLLLVGRVANPNAILKTVGGWTRLPLPGASDLVRSIADDGLADVVDLSQPVDGAVALAGTARDPKGSWAFSVAVRSFEAAKAKLGATHKASPGPNGSLWLHGVGKPEVPRSTGPDGVTEHDDDGDDDDDEGCSLAHGVGGARLVCGEKDGVEKLMPYLTRALPLQRWPSDVHVELRLAPAREPIAMLHAMLPILGRSAFGAASPAFRDFLEASAGELVDFAGDAEKVSIDAQLRDVGADATIRFDYQRAQSLIAKLGTGHPERADAPPAALFHMPGDLDLAFYSRGSDPALFERPRELVGHIVGELAGQRGMPESERGELRALLVDRMVPLFTGPVVYGKGFDKPAVDKGIEARSGIKPEDRAAMDRADHALAAQVVGWHLLSVQEPIAKVGPMLKDWARLWGRPAFVRWAKEHASQKMMARVSMAPLPAGAKLPKDALHLEITIPREDAEVELTEVAAPVGRKGARGAGKPPAPKKIPRKPIVVHVLAVPDQGSTWLAFGLDPKLLADKAALALSGAPDTESFGKTAGAESLRSIKANAAGLVTLRGLLVLTAMDRHQSAYGLLASLGNKGMTPITMAIAAQPPSAGSAAGSSVATLKFSRAAIEDVVKLVLSSR